MLGEDGHGADPRHIRTALRIRREYAAVYAGSNTDTRVSAVRSARRICPNRVEFDLSGQHTR